MIGNTFTKMRKARGRSVFEGEIKSSILDTSMRCLLNLLHQKSKRRTSKCRTQRGGQGKDNNLKVNRIWMVVLKKKRPGGNRVNSKFRDSQLEYRKQKSITLT